MQRHAARTMPRRSTERGGRGRVRERWCARRRGLPCARQEETDKDYQLRHLEVH